MTERSRLRKLARIAGYAGAALVALSIVVAIGAPLYFRGERFGRLVEAVLPEMRGRVHVGGGQWRWSTVIALARGQPAAVELGDVTVTDPEGTEVLYVQHAAARVQIQRSPTRITVDDLVLDNVRWRFARMKAERKVGFLATFEGVRRGRRAAAAPGGFALSIAGARLRGVDATLDFPDWALELRGVHATGAMAFASATFTFAVTDADVGGGGKLRVLAPGKGVVLPFARARLDRVATTADARDAIRLDASGIATGRSRTSGGGLFTGVYGFSPDSKHPGIDLEARVEDAGDAMSALLASRGIAAGTTIDGRGASLLLGFSGAFDQIAIDAEAHGFDVTSPRLEARDLGFSLTAEPLAGRFRLAKLALASPQGGRLQASATLDRLALDAEVAFSRYQPRALLPSALRRFVTGTLDGEVRARADLLVGTVELARSTLVLAGAGGGGGKHARPLALLAGPGTRPPPGATVVRFSRAAFAGGAIRLPRVTLGLAGGTIAAEGEIALRDTEAGQWLPSPRLALSLDARAIDVQQLVGVGFAGGRLSLHASARGMADDIALDVRFTQAGGGLTVLGERVLLPERATLRLRGSGLIIESLPLAGPDGSSLLCTGRIEMSGRLALDIDVRGFPIARLPGLAGSGLPVSGAVTGAVRVVGEPRAPAVSAEVKFADVSYRGERLGTGTLTVTPERGGAIHARGRLIDAIAVEGTLVPKAAGLEGEATLTLSKLRLDPFMPPLPLGVSAGGVVSGTLSARIAPGQPAQAEGRLTELSLAVTPPASRRSAARPLALRADGDIQMTARTDQGLSVGPARFRSDFGAFELTAVTRGDDASARVRGRIELGALAPFARRWLDTLQGAVDVDVTASRAGSDGPIATRGSATVAGAIVAKPTGLPLTFGVATGKLRLADDTIETTALPVTVRATGFPVAALASLAAEARVSARVDGLRARPKLRARAVLDKLDIAVPLAGAKHVRSAGGQVDVEADLTAGSAAVTRLDLPVEAEIEQLTATTGVLIQRAKLALRVRGAPSKLALSGDVDVGAARVRADALKQVGKSAGGGAGRGGATGGMLPSRPEIEAMALDIRVRSRGGAVEVEVPNFPDLRVDLDMHVGGTGKRPVLTGSAKGATLWSSFVLTLRRIFS